MLGPGVLTGLQVLGQARESFGYWTDRPPSRSTKARFCRLLEMVLYVSKRFALPIQVGRR